MFFVFFQYIVDIWYEFAVLCHDVCFEKSKAFYYQDKKDFVIKSGLEHSLT